ncbi:hypothetical protein [Streptosporangium saharense]|uniref:CopG family transcriptional regulator n=1 Tax=Streptosporangium saharense TaxID=1706840 RepID=A0A7W7QWA3_9ACTN|nr:hypothetical protein [Streptosporangium saharense]MBB4920943.1 hypothetical protein [Streptosporangium saharense]
MSEEKKEDPVRAAAPPEEDTDTLVGLGTKIKGSTRKRLRRYSVEAEAEIQDIVEQAISTYLEARGY